MINLREITLSRGKKILLEQASVSLYEKQKIGLVGNNGCGKTSLFSLLLGQLQTDLGECEINPQLRISHLSQQLADTNEPALDFILAGDEDYVALLRRLTNAEKNHDNAEVISCHELLHQSGGYTKPAKAAAIMAGLGFKSEEQQRPVSSFSGGWRMRLSLARCLMKPADLFLLDEPTNHLDLEAIVWLEKWLKQSPCTILLISHDRDFLDAFVTHVLHIDNKKMSLYAGDYSRFEQLRAQKLAMQQLGYEKQQAKIKHMMAYVQRFRAKASKAKQAQSRLNAIAKMDIMAQAQLDSPFSFEFYPCPRATNALLRFDEVTVGYQQQAPILKNINLMINPGDRIALLGPNGAGKSTLIKTLTGCLPPLSGSRQSSTHLTIGYYAQHQLEQLDNNLSPLQTIQFLSPDAKEQTIRDFLGGFNFIGDMASQPILHFSGGEKARLVLAKLVWLKPNVLLLDEPTNHLDLGMRAAIEIALQSYEGALVLISHDRHLLRTTANDFYLVYGKQVQAFKGDLNDYYQWLQTTENETAVKDTVSNQHYKEKRSLQNRLKKLEQTQIELQQQLKGLDSKLTDLSLYQTEQQQTLQALLNQHAALQAQLACVDDEWVAVAEALEDL
ncbi:MAG: ATP-binding cassette domain-containing protein [Legionella sp.]